MIDLTRGCVFPGRFQPFHNGHAAGLAHAITLYPRVIVAISNAHVSHTSSDPFTGGERYEMISAYLNSQGIKGEVFIIPVPVNDEPTTWVATIRAISPPFDHVYTRSTATETLFRYWGIPNSPTLIEGHDTSASDVRGLMATGDDWKHLVPPHTAAVIDRYDGARRVQALSAGRNHRIAAPSSDPLKKEPA